MTIHKTFLRKSKGETKRQTEQTIKSISAFSIAAQNLFRDWEQLLHENNNMDTGSKNYPKNWDTFDVEVDLIKKWATSFKEQLRKVK